MVSISTLMPNFSAVELGGPIHFYLNLRIDTGGFRSVRNLHKMADENYTQEALAS